MWSGGAPGAVVAISRGWGLGTQIHCLYIIQHCNPCTDVQLYSVCILYSIRMHTYIQSYNGPRHTFQPFCFVILQKMWVCTTLRVQWCFVSKKVFEFPKKIKRGTVWFIFGAKEFIGQCILGAMHCQLYCAGLLPQWCIYFIYLMNDCQSLTDTVDLTGEPAWEQVLLCCWRLEGGMRRRPGQ